MTFVPPILTPELLAARREREAAMLLVVERSDVCKQFDPELQRIDSDLSMVFCPEPAPLDVVACGARPGRFNIMRSPESGPRSFMPIIGPDGEFVEPTSRVFEQLKEMDWWNPLVRQQRRVMQRRAEDARVKRESEERRRVNEEMYDRYMAGSRTFVSMDRDNAWTQSHRGKRGAKA